VRPRTLPAYVASRWLVIGLALAGGCLNPRPEDFPSVNDLEAENDRAGSPGNAIGRDPERSGDDFFEGEGPASQPEPVSPPSAPGGNGGDGDAGAPPSDGGTAAAAARAAAARADGGASLDLDEADECDAAPDGH
jgi:hypothetical protein